LKPGDVIEGDYQGSINNHALKPGDVIEGDYQGPFSLVSVSHSNGNVKFVDVATKYVVMTNLKGKNSGDIAKSFKTFYALLENQTGLKIKVLRTDLGLEFQGHLSDFLAEKGVIHPLGQV
jgi:hypothetical protein